MLFTVLNFKVLHQNLKIISATSFTEIQIIRLYWKMLKEKLKVSLLIMWQGFFKKVTSLSQRQPKHLLRLLCNFSISRNPNLPKGIFKCNDKGRKICRLYIIECSKFELANRKMWKIRANITCHSRNIFNV